MTPLADETIAADHRTYERLARLVGTLTDEQLTQPSGASGWTVAQVLSHLGSGAEITLETLRAAQAGTDRAADANQAVWARWNAMSPREQADGYVRAGAELDRAVAGLDPAQRVELRVPMGFLPSLPASICSPACGSTRPPCTPGTWKSRSTPRPPFPVTSPPSSW